jgi:hypothetical protein
LKKINSALSSFNKDLIKKYGDIKCFIYRFWDGIIHNTVNKNIVVKKITYTYDNKTVIYVHSENDGTLLKLHYMIPHIIEQIKYNFGKNLDIEIKISK